jgi:hypothetical protein
LTTNPGDATRQGTRPSPLIYSLFALQNHSLKRMILLSAAKIT